MTTLQNAEKKVYTGLPAMERAQTHKIIRNEAYANMVYFFENGELMGTQLSTGITAKRSRDISFFMDNEFVDYVEPLKVGDYAKVVDEKGCPKTKVGDIVKILSVEDMPPTFHEIEKLDKSYTSCVMNKRLVKATEAEVQEAQQALLKVGSFVKVISRDYNTRVKMGQIVKIIFDDKSGIPFAIHSLEGFDMGWIRKSHVVPATEVEVQEAQQALLKVGDYVKIIKGRNGHSKEGDIIKLVSKETGGFRAEHIGGEEAGFKFRERIVPATKGEVLEAKRAALKVGDYAKVISNEATTKEFAAHEFPMGTIVKLTKDHRLGGFRADYLDGHDYWCVMRQDLKPLTAEEVAQMEREAAEKKAKEERLKVGEFAKVTTKEGYSHMFKVGDIVEVIQDDNSKQPFKSKRLSDGKIQWFAEKQVVRATEEEVLAAKRAALKVGDYAKVINNESSMYKAGTIVKITDKHYKKWDFQAVGIEKKDANRNEQFFANELIPATEEEVAAAKQEFERIEKERKEKEKWSAIGRKVGELKKGDIVKVTDTQGGVNKIGDVGEVTQLGGSNGSVRVSAGRGEAINWCLVEIIVPVEQRFDK